MLTKLGIPIVVGAVYPILEAAQADGEVPRAAHVHHEVAISLSRASHVLVVVIIDVLHLQAASHE